MTKPTASVHIDIEPPKIREEVKPKPEPMQIPVKDDSKSPARKTAKMEIEPQPPATTARRSWRDKMAAAKESSNTETEKKVTLSIAPKDDEDENKENKDTKVEKKTENEDDAAIDMRECLACKESREQD